MHTPCPELDLPHSTPVLKFSRDATIKLRSTTSRVRLVGILWIARTQKKLRIIMSDTIRSEE